MTFMHVTRANQETAAAYSSWTEVQVHVLPAIKAGLAIPWNTLRLLRRYVTTYSKGSILTHWCFRWLKSSGICLAGEERMHLIFSQIVGDNPKGEIAPFSGASQFMPNSWLDICSNPQPHAEPDAHCARTLTKY